MRHAFAALLALTLTLPAAAEPPPPGKAVFFPLSFRDDSTEGAVNGPRADEAARLASTEAKVREALEARGFTLLDPPAGSLDGVRDPADCNGCERRIAEAAGADYAITGQVQKTSNLILSVNLAIRNVDAAGETGAGGVVDIRGNTDDSWQRGYRYLLKNIIFKGVPAP